MALEASEGQTPAVVVTGGSSGIGLAIAVRFARSGRRVALVARDEIRLSTAADVLRAKTGQAAVVIACDITDSSALLDIQSRLREEGCYLDILVNNAGAGTGGDFVHQEAADIAGVIDINIQALTRLTRQALPDMIARGRGGIINVSSLGGLLPGPYQAVYYASKAYVISFTRAVAFEVSGRGVRVSCVAPGPVRTNFHDALDKEHRALYRYLLPWNSPDRVAASAFRGFWIGHPTIVPGFFNFVLSKIVGLLPYAVAAPLVGLLLYPGPTKQRERRSDPKNNKA